MRINSPPSQLLLIHTICPAIHRRVHCWRDKRYQNSYCTHTQIQFMSRLSETSCSNSCSTILLLLLLPQIILKCTTTQSPSRAVNKVLFSLRGAIDMNRDSYINSRLLFQSPPRWGLGRTLHDSAQTLLLLFTLGLCLPGNHWPTVYTDSLPCVSQENPWARNEPTPAMCHFNFLKINHWRLLLRLKAELFLYSATFSCSCCEWICIFKSICWRWNARCQRLPEGVWRASGLARLHFKKRQQEDYSS